MDSMNLERCSCSASSAAGFTEMDAAEALAELAQLAMRESVAAPATAGVWGSKGKRVSKRVKSESPPPDLVSNSFDSNRMDSVQRCLDLAEDRVKVDTIVLTKPVKVELDAQSPKTSSIDATRHATTGSSRSRPNLTEAEKEERRIRRILANRESARQTIRRRQALCEELTRKAGDLTLENEDLKKKKELALKEYQSLETMNKQLKAQMAKAIKAEVEETAGELKPTHVEISASPSTNCPFLLYNQHSFFPVCWPSIIQSSNPGQSPFGPQNTVVIPSNIPLQATGGAESPKEQGNLVNRSGPRAPLYMVPYTWFYPLSGHGNGLHPQSSFGLRHVQDETCVSNQSTATLKTLAHAENREFSLPIKVKIEATGSTEATPTADLNETLFDSPSDGVDQRLGTHLMLAPQAFVGPALAVKCENVPESDYTSNIETIPTIASHNRSSYSKKDLVLTDCPSKKITDAVAAAEARKRRKELTKLKNLYGRQCRMQC